MIECADPQKQDIDTLIGRALMAQRDWYAAPAACPGLAPRHRSGFQLRQNCLGDVIVNIELFFLCHLWPLFSWMLKSRKKEAPFFPFQAEAFKKSGNYATK